MVAAPSAERAAAPQREGEEAWTRIFPTSTELEEFVDELRALRREVNQPSGRWTIRAVRLAIGKALEAEYDPTTVAAALRDVARDPDTQLPGRVAQPGPWWDRREAADLDHARAARRAQRAEHHAALGHRPCGVCGQSDDLDGAGRCGRCAAAGAGPVTHLRSETA